MDRWVTPFATPLTLAIHTAVTMLYRQDVLRDETASAPGRKPRRPVFEAAGPPP